MGFFSTIAGLRSAQKVSFSTESTSYEYSPTLLDAGHATDFDDNVIFSSELANYTVPEIKGVRKFTPILTDTIVVCYTMGTGNTYTHTSINSTTTRSSYSYQTSTITAVNISGIAYWIFPTLTNYYVPAQTRVNTYLIAFFCVTIGVFILSCILISLFPRISFQSFLHGCSNHFDDHSDSTMESSQLSNAPRSSLTQSLQHEDSPEEIERKAIEEQNRESVQQNATPDVYPPPPPPPPSDVKNPESNPYQGLNDDDVQWD